MSRKGTFLILLSFMIFIGLTAKARADEGWIYGKIYTKHGDVFEGRIRWDKNEVSWSDILDTTRKPTNEEKKVSKSEITIIDFFGIKIKGERTQNRQLPLRFGVIKSIEKISSGKATVELKNGEKVVVQGSGTDLGTSVRGIVIYDLEEGKLKLNWDDFEKVEFFPEPKSYSNKINDPTKRLYGKVATDEGDFEGFIVWDIDEAVSTDILDGEENGIEREIEFGKIRSIKKRFSDSSLVELKNGKELRLEGSNDVDDGNQGIVILDSVEGFVVKVPWEEFKSTEFTEGKKDEIKKYDEIQPGNPLKGKIHTRDGEIFEGLIKWDNDESSTRDFLDGKIDGIEISIEFSTIQSISRRSRNSVKVKLKSGREFILGNTVDVSKDNRGIFVMDGKGGKLRFSWDDFEKVEFD